MPTPDARPVGETALARDRLLHLLATHLVAGQEMTEHDRRLCDAALVAYRDAVAAEARAALLAGAPTVWVATELPRESLPRYFAAPGWLFIDQPTETTPGQFVGHGTTLSQHLAVALGVPPGTVRRAYLVIPEGEETPT